MFFEKWKEEKIFLFIMVTVGFLIMYLTPPMCTPDENTHFANAVSVGYGNIFPDVSDGELGRYMSKEIVEFINYNLSKYSGKLEEKCTFKENYFASWLPSTENELVFRKMSAINPLCYAVAALGIRIGSVFCRFFGDGYEKPYNLLMFGRLFNAIFYMIVGYFAIKITPVLKRTMMVLLLMPMSIYLGVSISYDAIIIPVCALFFANTFKLILCEDYTNVTKRDIGITLGCACFLMAIKTVYAPFMVLLLFVPKEKFGSKKRYIYCVAATILTAVVAYGGYQIVLRIVLDGYQAAENPLLTQQKQYFFSHLYEIPRIAAHTIKNNYAFYIEGFYGKLGQIDTNFILPFACAFYILLILIVSEDIFSTTIKIRWQLRITDILLVIISLGGIFGVMYLRWTPLVLEVGGLVVSGVQGRYFIPAFLFICFPFLNGVLLKFDKWKIKLKNVSVLLSEILILNSAVWTSVILLLRYWC